MQVRRTELFDRWLKRLHDTRAKARINTRIKRFALGNPGDVRSVGKGVSELRIDYGPGYRVYFVQQGRDLAILLTGGDKDSQQQDVAKAQDLARLL